VLGKSVGYASERMKATAPPTHPSSSRHEPPIDENVLDGLHRLSRDGRPDLCQDGHYAVPGDGANDAAGSTARRRKQRPQLIARASHILSAPAAAVGAVSLAARCKELEAISRTGAVADAAARVQLIQRLDAEAESALRSPSTKTAKITAPLVLCSTSNIILRRIKAAGSVTRSCRSSKPSAASSPPQRPARFRPV
jgi:HPt (histidine-containing phosphotransfer) domain-containing protein